MTTPLDEQWESYEAQVQRLEAEDAAQQRAQETTALWWLLSLGLVVAALLGIKIGLVLGEWLGLL